MPHRPRVVPIIIILCLICFAVYLAYLKSVHTGIIDHNRHSIIKTNSISSHRHPDIRLLYAENVPGITCLESDTKPRFMACLLPTNLSDETNGFLYHMSQRGTSEFPVWLHVARACRIYPHATFIDGGANIGFYTILAAAMGLDVIAVEPMPFTARCIQKSMYLNNLTERITLVNNALSDTRTSVTLSTELADKMGTVKVMSEDMAKGKKHVARVNTVFMDDLIPLVHTKTAILKLDIQGHECKALHRAEGLMSKLFVPYIFIEWNELVKYKTQPGSPCDAETLQRLVDRLYDAGYVPYRYSDVDKRIDRTNITNKRIVNIYWKHNTAPILE